MSATPRQIANAAVEAPSDAAFVSASIPLPKPRRKSVDAARGPLSGLRLMEFVAGPMAGRILGFLDAEVIHVKS
jgi:hypothetical protein